MERTLPIICALTLILNLSPSLSATQEGTPNTILRLPKVDLDDAIERYATMIQVTREAGQRVDPAIEAGYDEFLSGDYASAVQTLEALLPTFAPGYFMPYRVLGVSYEKIGRPVDAEAAYENAVSMYPNDPLGWNALRRLRSHAGETPRVVQRPKWKTFPNVLAAGSPAEWSSDGAIKGITAYAAYVDEVGASLDALGVQNIARAVALYALVAAENAGKAAKYADGVAVIAALDASGLPAKVPKVLRRQKDAMLVRLYVGMHALLNAAATLDQLARGPDADASEDAQLLLPILYATYDSVSWDPTSGKRRTDDPTDFLDLSTKYRDELGRPKKPTRATVEFPYGMNNPHEDTATVGENVAANFDLMRMLRERIAAQNFELPVKVFIHRLISATTGLGAEVNRGPFAELRMLLEKALSESNDTIAASTRDAFDVALLIDDLLRARPLRAPLPF